MRVVVVGGGKLVYFLAKRFLAKAYEVTIINKNKESCIQLSRELNAVVVHGDGSDPRILKEVEINKADAVVALTPRDHDNLFISQLAKTQFGVPRAIALVNNPENEELFKEFGIEGVFNTTNLLSTLIEQNIATDDIHNLLSLEGGRINLSLMVLKEDSPAVNKAVKDLEIPRDVVFGAILRGEQVIIPGGNTVFASGDKVIIISLPEKQAEVYEKLCNGS